MLQGTSAEQDNRFSNKEKKLMREMKFSDNLAKKVGTVADISSLTYPKW